MTSRYAPIEAWLTQEIGLDPTSIGPSTIALATAGRMAAQKTGDVAEYAALVAGSRVEAQKLIEAIVVPETSFFRDHHPFIALRRWAAQEWVPAHPSGVMRLLSMPCSTGEEPFSIAMALLEEGVERFLVEGVDISSEALARAEQGLYRRNSFRGGMREEVSRRFFTMKKDGEWRISDEVRQHVRFRQANLLDPAFGEGSPLYDVIFCRNLLIYLDSAAQGKVMEKIKALLAPGGLLCVGHAEAYLFSQFGFQPSGASMAFCFRATQEEKGSKRTPFSGFSGVERPSPSPHLADPLPRQITVPGLPGMGSRPFALQPAPSLPPLAASPLSRHAPVAGGARATEPVPEEDHGSDQLLEESQRFADGGDFRRAEELALMFLDRHGPSARLFCLLALICDAQGREEEAAAYYRKTLYLEPGHAEALAHLSLFLRRRGDSRGYEQLQRRLNRIQEQGGLKV